MWPRIPNHLLCCLLYFMTLVTHKLYHSKESTHGDTTAQVWSAHHDLGVVDYKALAWLSLLRVPHFCARHGASLKDINPDTTSTSEAKCFLVGWWNTRKYTNIGKALKLQGARLIYQVGQITHRAITTNKRDQLIVIMHTSKLKRK
jgi:hypothetical protein